MRDVDTTADGNFDDEDWEESDCWEDEELDDDQIRVRDAIDAAERSPEDGVPELLNLLLDTDLDAEPWEHRLNVMRCLWRIGGDAARITWWLLEYAPQWYELQTLYLSGGSESPGDPTTPGEVQPEGWRYLIRASEIDEDLRFEAAEALLAPPVSPADRELVRSLIRDHPHHLAAHMYGDHPTRLRAAACAVSDRSLPFNVRFDLADAHIGHDRAGGLIAIATLLGEDDRTRAEQQALLELQAQHLLSAHRHNA